MGEMYNHPDIRTQTHDQMRFRLDQIRNRRLVAAIEFKSVQDAKTEKLDAKLGDQWEKLSIRCAKKLEKINEELNDIDQILKKLVDLNHKKALTEFKL